MPAIILGMTLPTTVTVKLYAGLRDLAGVRQLDVPFAPGGSARDLLDAIARTCPPLGEKLLTPDGSPNGFAHLVVDGRNVRWLDDLDTVIAPGSSIDLIPPVAGG